MNNTDMTISFAPQKDDLLKDPPLNSLPVQERVAAVRPYWQRLSQEERVKLLTIDLEAAGARAKALTAKMRAQGSECRFF